MKRIHFLLIICSSFLLLTNAVYAFDTGLSGVADNMQQSRVTGKVTDAATGEPLLGVTVVVKGTTIGQITDPMGNYSINIPSKEVVLVFSSIGYASQEIMASEGAVINVALSLDVLEMDEVVVIGYGVQKKETVVGSISQATGDQIMTSLRGADLTNALTGNLPGLITIQNNGIPGGSGAENAATQIFIRGQKTWNNAQPLILVDGIEREMSDVDPYTVEGVSVLKDASATAVFGVKGANGVILITTKRGSIGRPRLTFSASTSGKAVSRLESTLNSYEGNLLKNYAILNEVPLSESGWKDMLPQQYLEYYRDQTYPDYLPDVNWKDEMLKDYAIDRNLNLSIAGGTKFVKYFGSLSYLNEGDVLKIQDYGQGYSPNFEFNRFNYRSNLDFSISPTTTFTVNLSGFYSGQKRPRQGLINQDWFSLYSFPPDLLIPRYSDGTWGQTKDPKFTNQLVNANFTGYSLNKRTQVNSDFQLVQNLDVIIKGLSLKGKFSYDITAETVGPNLVDNSIITKYISKDIMNEIVPGMSEEEIKAIEAKYTDWIIPQTDIASGFDYINKPYTFTTETGNGDASQNDFYRALNYELSLNYNRDFGKHNVGGLFLFSRNESARGSIFPRYREDWVGRVVYNYDTRYLFEFNGAYNGSEQFGKDFRFGFFPSVAAGWILSNEAFFKPITTVVNTLKFRFSSGIVGNDEISNDPADRWLYEPSWQVDAAGGWFGGPYIGRSIYPYRREGKLPNPFLQWETARKSDIGFESEFFNRALSLSFDYFWEKRTNIFVKGVERIVPVYFGAEAVAGNIGEVKNEGWEVETDFKKTSSRGFSYHAGLAVSFSKDIIIKKADTELTPAYQKFAGFPIDQPRILMNENIIDTWNDVYTGVLGQNNTQILPGDNRIIDFDSDGIITVKDNAPYGYTNRPQYTYSPRVGMSYKGFSADVQFYGAFNLEGFRVEPSMGAFLDRQTIVFQLHKEDTWNPSLGHGAESLYAGSRYMTQGFKGINYRERSYLRLKTVALSYTINSQFIKKMGVSGMRVFANGENLYLWSKSYRDSESNDGFNFRSYPVLKRLTFGINLNF
jgi:TonB-linked SusC/RagA family outer membrane protein